ncbi:MAG: septum formation initiator family protein [Chitinophagaceae bacterium]|nr:septum formation initiator family protein [Chitinophagaceae bacterium]
MKNKYILTLVCFFVWMVFFDDRDLITTHFRHPSELRQLEESRKYYTEQIRITREELDQLRSNSATIEKYAREKYHMKRENEDLFIISDK